MKTLQKIQEENRKFIIMANNPTAKTYDEALEMELGNGCLLDDVYYRGDSLSHENFVEILKYGKDNFLNTFISYGESLDMFIEPCEWDDRKIFQYKIIGKPLTLNRVLIALNNATKQHNLKAELCDQQYSIYTSCDNNYLYFGDSPNGKLHAEWSKEQKIKWDLTKETLEEKSEETQREFNELIK